nr:2-succinylbenzoate--CoA ligase [Chlamydiota bacterium]
DIANIYPNCLATLIETSSASKIACHTLQNHMISAKSVCKALKLSQEDIYCLNLPLFHISGIAIMIRTFLSGAQITFPETLETATHISMVPTQLYRFLNNGCTLPNCKCLLMGGAPLGEKLYKEALAKNLPLYSSYGMTETASMAMLKPPYSKTQILPHIELSLKEDGEILLRGPSLFSHYWGKRPRKKDWFATRDIGKLHRDGEIEILGRKDRQFISGGENIQPEEIEKILMQLDSIIGAHITPESDLEFGMRPKATVYTERPLSADAIKAQLKKFLPTYKIPEKIKIIIGEEASKLVLEPESSSPTPFQ